MEGREKERERSITVWLPLRGPPLGTWSLTQAGTLTRNPTGDPLVCRLALNHWATPDRALLSVLTGVHLEVELLDHMVILSETFWGIAKLFTLMISFIFVENYIKYKCTVHQITSHQHLCVNSHPHQNYDQLSRRSFTPPFSRFLHRRLVLSILELHGNKVILYLFSYD